MSAPAACAPILDSYYRYYLWHRVLVPKYAPAQFAVGAVAPSALSPARQPAGKKQSDTQNVLEGLHMIEL